MMCVYFWECSVYLRGSFSEIEKFGHDFSFYLLSEKYCGSPFDQVMNGYILNMTSPVFGGIVNFDCFEGFTLTKPDMAAPTDCSAMGTWANLPTCEGIVQCMSHVC